MHPLLVSAVARTASHFLDRWAHGGGAAPTAAPAKSFQTVLEGKTGAAAPAPAVKPSVESQLDRLARLRSELLDAPEIRAVFDTADPAKPATMTLTPDGRVLSAPPGRDPQPILLSPETATLARELATLTASPGGLSVSAQVAGASVGKDPRPGSLDLTPQTSVTTLR